MHTCSFILSTVEWNLLHFNYESFGTLEVYLVVLLVVKM